MFCCRILIFRLHESPRYLVSAGRKQEAVLALKKIAKFNGDELPSLNIDDVDDEPTHLSNGSHSPRSPRFSITRSIPIKSPPKKDYRSTETSPSPPLQGESFGTPFLEDPRDLPPVLDAAFLDDDDDDEEGEANNERETDRGSITERGSITGVAIPRPGGGARKFRSLSVVSTASDIKRLSPIMRALPRWIRRPLQAYGERLESLFTPEWKKTTILMWMIWLSLSTGEFSFLFFNGSVVFTSP